MKNFTEKENELTLACMTLAEAEMPENFELMVLKETAQSYIDNLDYIGVEVVVDNEITIDTRTRNWAYINTVLEACAENFTAHKIEATAMDLLTGEVYASYNKEIFNGGVSEHLYRSDEYLDNIERGE